MSLSITLSSPPDIYAPASYEHVAQAGDFAFIAGQVSRDSAGKLVGPGNAGEQAAQVYRNIDAILRHIGAERDQVVKITTYLVDPADSAVVAAERKAFFGEHRPPHTGLIVAALGGPEVKLEVELVVYTPRQA
ncbi:RidA family protein [Devosia sp. BK]|uniref:RidA family protein n=1 Tax=Devosia sp. BK TaxID=2871706 RepID=UPI00293B45A0|nr:RidA family protein [Devosia sp. BK]MDV3251101.1 RidA family protein [Devosia sp. BK]